MPLKKNKLSCLLVLILPAFVQAQGWIGKSTDTLIAYNSKLSTNNSLRVGIGTATPTAQLHTTGTVRLAGITNNSSVPRILGADANGNVFYRDASTFSGGNAWSLNGNSGTIPTTNFLGTIDNQPIVFRTNNTEKMKLISDGGWRIRPNANSNIIIRNSPNVSGENDNLGIDFVRNDAADNVTTNLKARIQFDGYPLTYAANPSLLHSAYIRFFTNDSLGNFKQRMVITPSGNVAIGEVYSYPASGLYAGRPFEVNCKSQPIRLRNLAAGTGNYLVIDANGDVRVSNSAGRMENSGENEEFTSMRQEIKSLREELNELKKQLSLSQTVVLSGINNLRQPTLDLKPNPANSTVNITTVIPADIYHAKLIIADANGRVVKRRNLSSGSSNIYFEPKELSAAGALTCSIMSGNKILTSKKLIVAK